MARLTASIVYLGAYWGMGLLPAVTIAQPLENSPLASPTITPAPDGTGTRIEFQNSQFDITGGSRSGSGQNLFHSFEKFDLETGQAAHFIAAPDIENILGQVTGGQASFINGQISGSSNANLFLINPAGILTGPNARIDLSGSFTATTANQLGFGDHWLNILGNSNYAHLNGQPNRFSFSASPGSVVNQGLIRVGNGQAIRLLGGTVFNTGSLKAPSGEVTLLSVIGNQTAILGQSGEIALGANPAGEALLTVPTLPELLQTQGVDQATNLTVDADGTVHLGGQRLPVDSGVTIASGQIDTTGKIGGSVRVLGERVGLIQSQIDASGGSAGGTVLIGGDYRGKGPVPNAQHTLIDADSTVSADAIDSGNGGRVIAWADDTTEFFGRISVQGGQQRGDGGFVEVSGKNNLAFDGSVNAQAIQGKNGQLLLDPGVVNIDDVGSNDGTAFGAVEPNQILTNQGGTNQTFSISANRIETALNTGDVAIAAARDINVNEPITATGNTNALSLEAPQIRVNQPITLAGGDLNLTAITSSAEAAQDISVLERLRTNGGDVNLSAPNIELRQPDTAAVIDSGGGDITLDGAVVFRNFFETTRIDSTGNNQAGNVRFSGTVDGQLDDERLVVDASTPGAAGDVMFEAAIGSNTPPLRLEVFGKDLSLTDLTTDSRILLRAENDVVIQADQPLTLRPSSQVEAERDVSISAPSLTVLAGSSFRVDRNLGLTTTDAGGSLSLIDTGLVDAGDRLTINPAGNLTILDSRVQAQNELAIAGGGSGLIVDSALTSANGSLTLSFQDNGTLPGSMLTSGENLSITANQLNISETAGDEGKPAIFDAGGELTLSGANGITIQALARPESLLRSGANLTLNSDSDILANIRIASGRDFSAGPGALSQPGISNNNIISADGDVTFGDYSGSALKVEATGSITTGDIDITEAATFAMTGDPDVAILNGEGPALILRAGVSTLQNTVNLPPDQAVGGTTISQSGAASSPIALTTGSISTVIENDTSQPIDAGAVILSSTGSIQTGDIEAGRIEVSAIEDLQVGNVFGDGEAGNFEQKDYITGDIRLVSENGNIVAETVISSVRGRIEIDAAEALQVRGSRNLSFTSSGPSNVPTSIIAPSRVSIRHGGSALDVGVGLEQDAEGNIVFRDSDGESVVFADNGGPANFVKLGGAAANYPVSVQTVPVNLNEIPADESYTVGGVFIGNRTDAALYGSFQDEQLSGSGDIEVVTVPRAPTPAPIPTPTPGPTPGPAPGPIAGPVPTPVPGPTPSPSPTPSPAPNTIADASDPASRTQRQNQGQNQGQNSNAETDACQPGSTGLVALRSSSPAPEDAISGDRSTPDSNATPDPNATTETSASSPSSQRGDDPCRQLLPSDAPLLRNIHDPQLPPDTVPPEFTPQS